jgi:hypothetical protein
VKTHVLQSGLPEVTADGATIRPLTVWVVHPVVAVVNGPLTRAYKGARIGDEMSLTLRAPFPDWLDTLVKEHT